VSWRRSAEPTFLRRLPGRSLRLLSLGALLAAYGSSSCSSSGSASSTGTSCASAGGTCVLGGASCARQASSSAQDCETNPPNPGGAFCCLALSDAGSATADAGREAVDSGADAAEAGGACMISASSYDQSCMQDTDCVGVRSTNYCNAQACLCGGSAINMSALAQFNADVATTAGEGLNGVRNLL
jgi:hypothetical protein